tara:strand:+ start:32 stop:658 length:627 start_codon:yes stop_codon:yes gene_type:complete
MESELLRNELQNVRNHLTTLARNIDNTLLAHNTSTRSRTRTAARRNLNNLFSELRNLYPYTNTTFNENSFNNLNTTNTNTQINENLNEPLRNPYSNLFTNPEMIEVTLLNNGRRTVNNMEDVQVYPSLRTLRESSSIHIYRDLDTDQETCSICRDNFEENSVVRRLGCEHIFHIGCIDTWFETNIRCPLCRVDLRDTENDNETETEPT